MGCSRSARAVWFENPLGRGELDPQFIGASLTDDVSHPNTARSNVTCAPCEAAAELLNKLGGVVQPPAGGVHDIWTIIEGEHRCSRINNIFILAVSVLPFESSEVSSSALFGPSVCARGSV